MIRENIIKSINETLKELPHKAYIWKKDFPQVRRNGHLVG